MINISRYILFLDLPDPALARLPSRDHIKRRIRKLRQTKDIVQAPNDPNFPAVPIEFTRNHCHQQFLRCDTGPGTLLNIYNFSDTNSLFETILGEDRILIFSSDEQISILQSTQDFLVDGTFKIVPEIFYQLYIIYSVYRHHVVPVVFALLRRKDAETYKRLMIEILKFAPLWVPQTIMLDFEQACIKVYQSIFPNVTLSGCYFHFRQNIHRKIQVKNE